MLLLRSQRLRGACNILICIQAVMDILISFGHVVYFYCLYTETLITFSECYKYQFIPCSAMNITTALMLAIGMDRFLCLKYAVRYKKWPTPIYLAILLVSCILYDVLIKTVGYMSLTHDPVICLIADGYVGLGKDLWVYTQVIINVCVVIVYKMIHNQMKLMEDRVTETKKIISSLFTIVICYIFGWLMTMCLLGVVRVLTTESNLVVTCEVFAGIFANINMVIPAFIYYRRSSIYKTAFKELVTAGLVGPASLSFQRTSVNNTSANSNNGN
ncbi:hypothetical protein L596_017137 [Steinernema carpocapsae]|uniref:G-protein coupled receptors family 1 profile domain-containing protein n=1 Tax=Steinernema carpocapsae TaxID=34508 RepID=A0A4U5N0N7_STECR|nr:hypothetical protein L596_017137 [Steinernema carpocapsae]